ncbi:MAG: hypothetical protein DMF64_05125 [Acidobacteria bacterium]|nr:MAG: hypothetical protein DMF64_05125 [Acidobacteriota bacterium]
MRQTVEFSAAKRRMQGGSRLNFLIVMAILIAAGYVGYQVVPVVYRATLLESFMQDTVNNAAVANKSTAWVDQQIRGNAEDYGLPKDALIETRQDNGRLETHVKFTRTIPLVVTTYEYKFDHTVRSTTISTS